MPNTSIYYTSIRFIRVILPLTNFPVQHCLLHHLVLYSPRCPLPNLKSRKRKNKNLQWSIGVNDNPMALCFSGDFPLEAQRNLIIIEGRIYCDCGGVRHPHDQTLRGCYLSQLPGCALSRKKNDHQNLIFSLSSPTQGSILPKITKLYSFSHVYIAHEATRHPHGESTAKDASPRWFTRVGQV